MKKIYLTFSLTVFSLLANAQQRATNVINSLSITTNNVAHLPNSYASAVSTQTAIQITTQTTTSLIVGIVRSTTNCPVGGYTEGTNCYGDQEKANFFPASKYASITSSSIVAVDFLFFKSGNRGVSGSANTVTCSIYNGSLASGPTGSPIGYATASLSQIIAAQTNTNSVVIAYTFTLTSRVATPSSGFFASISVPNSVGDTIVVFNQENASSNFGWEKQANNAWIDMNTSWGSTYNANLSIYPILVGTTATGVSNVSNDLTLLASFPNPAVNEVSINFGLNQSSKISIEVYDVTGKLVSTTKLDQLEAGNHTSKLDVSHLMPGVYLYAVKSNTATLYSKFSLVK